VYRTIFRKVTWSIRRVLGTSRAVQKKNRKKKKKKTKSEVDFDVESQLLIQDTAALSPVRNRTTSNLDEFFDCVDADLVIDGVATPTPTNSTMPPQYNNDSTAYNNSLSWRADTNVDSIHDRPHPHFKAIKLAYQHVIHGRANVAIYGVKTLVPVIWEKPGQMNLKELFKSGVTIENMLEHYTYFMEFISTTCFSGGHPTVVIVMDVKGISLSALSGDVLAYLRAASTLNSSHYPNR